MARKTKEQMKSLFNSLLEGNNQKLRLIDYSSEQLILSNGDVLTNNEQKRFCRRVRKENWVNYIDDIYLNYDISVEKKVKSIEASKGGKAVQEKYREELKQNLNTGIPWNKGKKTGLVPWNKGLTISDDDRLLVFSKPGSKNPMYGVRMTEEQKKAKSEIMKEKIRKGDFTPNIHNSRTHWQVTFNGKKYRSSWEALFQYFNKDYEYETVRIPYNFNNENKIYIVDFVNHKEKHLVEIKPKSHRNDAKTLAKEKAAKEWCKERNYNYNIITEDMLVLQEVYDYSCFDLETKKRIEKLYETYKKNRD